MKTFLISLNGYFLLLLLISIFLFTGCTREEANPDAWPIVKTGRVIIETDEGGDITFKGELILPNNHLSITYGFYFGVPDDNKERYFLSAQADNDPLKFAASLGKTIKPDTKYYVIAWVKTDRYEVYGDTVFFSAWQLPPPVITSIYPTSGKFGDTIMITGKYFDFYNQNNEVTFNFMPANKSWSRQDTIWAIVPEVRSLPTLDIDVHVNVYGSYAKEPVHFSIEPPVITSVSATKGLYPDTIHITGKNFDPGYMSIMVGNVRACILRETPTSISYVVPFVGSDQSVTTRLNWFSLSVPVQIQMISQQFLGVTAKSAMNDDTLTLRALNMDFRKFPIYGEANGIPMEVVNKWQDSVSFILHSDYHSPEFRLSFILNREENSFPFGTLFTAYTQTITHLPPVLVSTGKTEYSYLEPIYINARGIEFGRYSSSVIIKTADGSRTFTFMPLLPLAQNQQQLPPGNYTMQVSTEGNRFSNILSFAVKAPVPLSISPSVTGRTTPMEVSGNYLPAVSDVVFTHQASGRKFYKREWPTKTNAPGPQPLLIDDLIGSGTYSAAIEIPGQTYPFPGTVTVADHFEYVRKINSALPWEYDARPSFAIGRKLYVPMSTILFTINLDNGSLTSKSINESVNGQPVFFNNNVYMSHYNYAGSVLMNVFYFDPITSNWRILGGPALPISKLRPALGVFNNQLIAICNNSIYRYDQGWILLNDIENPRGYHLTGDQVLYHNGNLYLFDLTFGYVNVINTATWTADRQIKLPNTYRGWERFAFEQEGAVYYYAIPENTGSTQYKAYRFNSADETLELLEPGKLNYARNYTFCPDGAGNTYFIDNTYIYKFKP